MPTTIIKTVKPSGGDYTSLAAAEAGEQRDLTAVDQIAQIDCYAMQDTTACTISGWTTDATRYVFVNVPASERHNGRRSPTKYRLEASVGFGFLLNVGQSYTRLHGLQLRNTAASPKSAVYANNATGIIITDTIVYDVAASSQPNNGGYMVANADCIYINCGAYNCGSTGFGTGTSGIYTAYNCVAVNCGGYSGTLGYGFSAYATGAYMVLKNCYAGGNFGSDYFSSSLKQTALTNCYSEDGSVAASSLGGQATTTAAFSTANFTNVTPGSEDLSLPAGSALIDAGTDLSTDPNWVDPAGFVDIVGTTRPQGTAWDVGAFEYISVGTTHVTKSLPVNYNVRGSAIKSLTASYSVRAETSKVLTLAYNIAGGIPKSLTAIYNVRNSTNKSLSPNYIIRSTITKTLSSNYTVASSPTKSLAINYKVQASIVSTLVTSYAVRNNVTDSLTVNYTIRESADKSLTASYNIRSTATISLLVKYSLGDSPGSIQLWINKLNSAELVLSELNSVQIFLEA